MEIPGTVTQGAVVQIQVVVRQSRIVQWRNKAPVHDHDLVFVKVHIHHHIVDDHTFKGLVDPGENAVFFMIGYPDAAMGNGPALFGKIDR